MLTLEIKFVAVLCESFNCEHQAMRSNILILVGWGASGGYSEKGDLMSRLRVVYWSKHSGLVFAKF